MPTTARLAMVDASSIAFTRVNHANRGDRQNQVLADEDFGSWAAFSGRCGQARPDAGAHG